MDDLASRIFSSLASKNSGGADLGNYLKGELEEAISPVTSRVTTLEKKIDILLLTVERLEKILVSFQPVIKIINKLPFIK